MKYILSIILFFLLVGSLSAQNEQDQVIFKAMQDEMQRSKDQLMLPGMQKPYYLIWISPSYPQTSQKSLLVFSSAYMMLS